MSEKLQKCRIIETEDLGEFQVGGVNKVVNKVVNKSSWTNIRLLILAVRRLTHKE